uniref:BTB/POZ domain-containing adapter for CUL3-mediated RhoA degradation protein 2 n=1 Tax=Xiphophorus couchianus TaxID=32473 RepID=A0A3B5LIN9_9TELE
GLCFSLLNSTIPPTWTKTCGYRGAVTLGNKYVRLNVGGILFFTPLQVLTSQNSLLGAMFGGKTEVFTDKEGWVLIDRSGKHFNSILNYLRDGTVTLPKGRQAVQELLAEAKYYLIQGLVELCQNTLQGNKEQPMCVIPVITSCKEEEQLVQSSSKVSTWLSLSFNSRVLFFKDVIGDEICCWSFYGQGRKLAEVCCTSIVYATEKKQTKVEFPEARIYEETLNTLLYETLPLPDNSLLEATRRSYNNCGSLSEEEEGPGGTELRERVRRIHIKRYSTYDDRPLGH